MTTRQKIFVPALAIGAIVAAGTRVETARAQNAAPQAPGATQDS